MGPPREVVVISSDEDEEERSGKLAVSPGRLGWVAKLDDALARVPRRKKGKGGGVRVGEDDDDDDDCVVLDGDPHKPAAVPDAKGRRAGDTAADEVEIVAVKGEIACKDFPHSRHVCSELPFGTTSHVKHCSMCYCFVCDAPAPCKYWGKGLLNDDHCHATDKETKWKTLRQAFKCKIMLRLHANIGELYGYGRLVTVSKAAAAASPSAAGAEEETPSPSRSVCSSSKLYVGNLPWEVDGSELKQLFSGYGEVIHAKVVYHHGLGARCSRGFGFVTMATQEAMEDALCDLDKQIWRGRKLRVQVAREEGTR